MLQRYQGKAEMFVQKGDTDPMTFFYYIVGGCFGLGSVLFTSYAKQQTLI